MERKAQHVRRIDKFLSECLGDMLVYCYAYTSAQMSALARAYFIVNHVYAPDRILTIDCLSA